MNQRNAHCFSFSLLALVAYFRRIAIMPVFLLIIILNQPAFAVGPVCGADTSIQLDMMVNCGQQASQERRWNLAGGSSNQVFIPRQLTRQFLKQVSADPLPFTEDYVQYLPGGMLKNSPCKENGVKSSLYNQNLIYSLHGEATKGSISGRYLSCDLEGE
jgi:hypothetical protein